MKKILVFVFTCFVTIGFSQKSPKKEIKKATYISKAVYVKDISPLKGKDLIKGKPRKGNINPRRTDGNKIVPGKGSKGPDPLVKRQKSSQGLRVSKAISLTFEANTSTFSPSDPTGAVGPNHYVSAKNFEFAIHDRAGVEVMASVSLENLFPGESLGDPIVFYDSFADRFVVTQFSNTPNGFLVAVCKGSDPVNDGWFTYRFNTGSFPDYTKFSIWSDGYYVTANKDQNSLQNDEVVFVIERDKMLKGDENAKMVGFPLPGARIGGFYSPASFNAIGNTLPPDGDARIIYYQDDAWQGVTEDALKLWTINVDWVNLAESTIAESEELTVSGGDISAFDTTFDGGSFGNLPQPGSGQDIDVLQGAVMYATNYRRFCDYNAVVLNFAVDIDDRQDSDNVSGIRWYELRQNGDGQPWTVYQEGTYTSTDGKSAWCGSMAMDIFGNIGMGYSTIGTTANLATEDSFVSIRYTGRLVDDPLGTMTFPEETIAIGTGINNTNQNRYGDYAQLTVDPVDDQTFWHIAEYFQDIDDNARNVVGVFKIAPDVASDVGVIRVENPVDAVLTTEETITVTIKNFGSSVQTDIPVSYSINGGAPVNELFAGPLNPGKTASFSFAATADLTAERTYNITAETNTTTDITPENDCATTDVKNLFANDVGVTALISPLTEGQFSSEEEIIITIFNYGGSAQSNIPVSYSINGGETISEVFTGTLASLESVSYTFTQGADLLQFGEYSFEIGTVLSGDEDATNNNITTTVVNALCAPTSDCAQFGDGITSFKLANVTNSPIGCNTGYEDFTGDFTIELEQSIEYTLTVQSGFADDNGAERFSVWIDFNDNNTFEASEIIFDNVIISEIDTDLGFNFTLDDEAAPGNHLFRIRAGDTNTNSGAPLSDPCGSMQFGSTHDYTVNIVNESTGPDPDTTTELIVVSEPENQFVITKTDTNAADEERIYVFNISGQIVASNLLKKDGNGTFTYELDMSYAKSGIYFVRLGSSKRNIAGFAVR
ncbi:GEVED domain-containing protein [Aquimarina gracilis]|uniref:GEVED domain-containing protein n=1 Tax=Aquimarina gracilis TaxID=874422 RepID=UPI002B469BAF|nr:GEVED domain-containing protein [Aquimarina gracilis]